MTEDKKEEVKAKILEEEDFVYSPRHANSILKLIDMNPDGISEDKICKALLISKKDLKKIYESAINKLRKRMGAD